MAKCINCSAPLAANTNKCLYCGTRNDVDLNNRQHYSVVHKESSLLCPHCEKTLQAIDLEINGSFLIHRCIHCFGLFFDAGKIEALLEKSVDTVFAINLQQLDTINQDRFPKDNEIKYVKCPVCLTFMSRNLYGYRSGVVVDRCQIHGIWLDSGEITHLLEWKKAGGQLLHEQQKPSGNLERPKQKTANPNSNRNPDYADIGVEGELLNTVANLIGKLFE